MANNNTSMTSFGKVSTPRMYLLLAVIALSGCGGIDSLMDRRQSATNQELSVEPSTLSIYLADVNRLLGGDSQTKERTWQELSLDFERAPTTTNQLRLALALATPGHPYSDLARADGMLTALLQKPQLLLGDERLLAEVHLSLLRATVNAESQARQAGNTASRSTARELATARSQLTLLQSENRRLRESLEETEEKLQAITLIERSIREREEDEPGGSGLQSGNESERD